MAKTKSKTHTVHHYPLYPFGRCASYPQVHDGRHYIELNGTTSGDFEPEPLSGCTFADPLSDEDKALLVQRGLATKDVSAQFLVNYAAIKRYLRRHGEKDEDLPVVRWVDVMEMLRADQGPEATHSEDYHSVRWYGQQHTFSHQQAAVVALLWTAYENGTPDLGQEHLLDKSGSSGRRLRDVFRENGAMHAAWNTMIVESRKGVFRLSDVGKKS